MDIPGYETRDLRPVFDAMGDGIIVYDSEGRLILANPAAQRLFGWDPSDTGLLELGPAIGLSYRDGSPVPHAEYPAARAMNGEVVRDLPFLFHGATGAPVRVLASASPLPDASGASGAIVSLHDVTSLEEANTLLQEAAQVNTALVRIGSILGSTLETDEIMQATIRETCDAVGAETAAIVLRKDGVWVTRYSYRFPSEIIGVVLTDEQAPHAAEALATRRPFAVDDAENDPRVNAEVLRGYGIRSVLTIPLIIQSRVIGVMFLNHHTKTVSWSPTQMDFVANVATSVSLALHNAELYAAQREVADTLQRAMLQLPERLPGVDFACIYRSATESARVGGDFYSVVQLSGERIGITVGDVSGKGLDAAATASVVKNTLRAYALAGDAPADILRKTNNVMGPSLDSASFVTALFGILDPVARTFTYSSGGHPPAVLFGPTGEPRLLHEGGTIIGPFAGVTYSEETCAIAPRDHLLLYTDGLTEARGDTRRYGEDRLLETVKSIPAGATAEQVVEHVFFDVLDFADGHLSDDMALLSIRLAPGA